MQIRVGDLVKRPDYWEEPTHIGMVLSVRKSKISGVTYYSFLVWWNCDEQSAWTGLQGLKKLCN